KLPRIPVDHGDRRPEPADRRHCLPAARRQLAHRPLDRYIPMGKLMAGVLVTVMLGGCVVYDPPPPAYAAAPRYYYPPPAYPAPVYAPPVYAAPVYPYPAYGGVALGFGFGGGRHWR